MSRLTRALSGLTASAVAALRADTKDLRAQRRTEAATARADQRRGTCVSCGTSVAIGPIARRGRPVGALCDRCAPAALAFSGPGSPSRSDRRHAAHVTRSRQGRQRARVTPPIAPTPPTVRSKSLRPVPSDDPGRARRHR